jgi:NADH-quinone oxidoreductase subunit M
MSPAGSSLVLLLLVLPAAGAAAAALLGTRRLAEVRRISLGITMVTALVALVLAASLMRSSAEGPDVKTFNPSHVIKWELVKLGGEGSEGVNFFIGLDGISIWLVVLTCILMVPSVLVSWTAIEERGAEFYAWLLALETAMLGVFLSFDIVLFYVFFELTLVPLFFLIGIWGGPQRRYAARKFFIYTLTGSLITLLGVLTIVLTCANDAHIQKLTFSIPELVSLVNERLGYLRQNPIDFAGELAAWQRLEFWVFLALAAGFAIKVPLLPFHTWLPLAHVEAPTAGSVLLAGVLLKIGAYGFLRLCLPLAPDASLAVGVPLIGTLAAIGVAYGALCAIAQDDMKKLVAYSSISHLGLCMLGIFSLSAVGVSGGLLEMINHGLSTGALFLIVGMLYERYHTRRLADYGGLGVRLKLLACFTVFFVMSSVGLPGLNGFVGEILSLLGIFHFQWTNGHWPVLGVLGTSGMVLGAWYLLTMVQRIFFGTLREPSSHGHSVFDLNGREVAALAPIACLCLFLGVYPQPVLDVTRTDVGVIVSIAEKAKAVSASSHALASQATRISLASAKERR